MKRLMIIALMLSLSTLASCGVQDKVSETVSDTVNVVSDVAENTVDAVGDVAEGAADVAGDAMEATGEAMQDAGEAMQNDDSAEVEGDLEVEAEVTAEELPEVPEVLTPEVADEAEVVDAPESESNTETEVEAEAETQTEVEATATGSEA